MGLHHYVNDNRRLLRPSTSWGRCRVPWMAMGAGARERDKEIEQEIKEIERWIEEIEQEIEEIER
jgi:hypothetical protein